MRFKEGYKVREIAGEHVVIMQGRLGADVTRVVALNETSVYLWERLAGKNFDAAVVRDILLERYDIDEKMADMDAARWVSKLRDCGLIED